MFQPLFFLTEFLAICRKSKKWNQIFDILIVEKQATECERFKIYKGVKN